MRNGKLVITALVLSVMVLALIILESFDIRPGGSESVQAANGGVSDLDGEGAAPEVTPRVPVFEFDLKYTKYLVEAPYEYEVNGETRKFEFEEMVKSIEPARKAFESGTVAYIDNYKNRNGEAP